MLGALPGPWEGTLLTTILAALALAAPHGQPHAAFDFYENGVVVQSGCETPAIAAAHGIASHTLYKPFTPTCNACWPVVSMQIESVFTGDPIDDVLWPPPEDDTRAYWPGFGQDLVWEHDWRVDGLLEVPEWCAVRVTINASEQLTTEGQCTYNPSHLDCDLSGCDISWKVHIELVHPGDDDDHIWISSAFRLPDGRLIRDHENTSMIHGGTEEAHTPTTLSDSGIMWCGEQLDRVVAICYYDPDHPDPDPWDRSFEMATIVIKTSCSMCQVLWPEPID